MAKPIEEFIAKLIIYARVSSPRQRKALKKQRRKARKYVKELEKKYGKKFKVIEIFDIRTHDDLNTKEFQKLRELSEKEGYAVVLASSVDNKGCDHPITRITRNSEELMKMINSGTRIINSSNPDETPEQLIAAARKASRLYKRRNRQKLLGVRRKKLSEGQLEARRKGGKARKDKSCNEWQPLIAVIQRTFEEQEYRMRATARALNKSGVKTVNGGNFQNVHIKRLLERNLLKKNDL